MLEFMIAVLLVSLLLLIGSGLLLAIHSVCGKIRYANARLIWRRVRRHRNAL